MRKIISIGSIVVIVAALGLVSYYYFVFDKIDPATGKKETFRQFLPFGSGAGPAAPATGGDGTPSSDDPLGNGFEPARNLPVLEQIEKSPIGGSMILEAPYASTTRTRYIDRATGNIYEYGLGEGTKERVTNTTLPMIVDSVWNPNGSRLVMRSLQNNNDYIGSYFAELEVSTSSDGIKEVRGSYLPTGIDGITRLGATDSIFTLMSGDGGAEGYTSAMDGTKRTLVFQSPIREWIAQGISPKMVALTTKASSYTPGFLYELDIATGALSKVLGNVIGLTTLMSPDGNYALFSENSDGFTLNLLDIKNRQVTHLLLSTLPDKCVWAPDSSEAYCGVADGKLNQDFLDLWYQGVVSTNDNLWVIRTGDTGAGTVASLSDKGFDMTNLSIDKAKKYVTFMNKKDLSLWVYRLPAPQAISTSTAATTTATSSR